MRSFAFECLLIAQGQVHFSVSLAEWGAAGCFDLRALKVLGFRMNWEKLYNCGKKTNKPLICLRLSALTYSKPPSGHWDPLFPRGACSLPEENQPM